MQATHRREFPGSRPPQAGLEQLSLVSLEADVERAMTRGGDPEGDVQTALRESEARYRLLFESNPQPMWVYDAEPTAVTGCCKRPAAAKRSSSAAATRGRSTCC
jgi:PAS domain-containing protein